MISQVLALDPATYQRHAIHGEGRIWAETNCYVDVWVELAHALGHDPRAALAFTLTIDFEGDQWTFFKFPLHDLLELFGLDVQELAIWRPLVTHLEEQLGSGRPVLVELDSFYLPDTAGTAYRTAHVKTTVAAVEIDREMQRLGYFHGQGYYRLEGQDFVDVLRINGTDQAMLPPYAELVKVRRSESGKSLVERSLTLLRKHLALVPESNPFVRFKERLQQDLASLLAETLDTFHQYSFATLRQYGACYELSATYLHWLEEEGQTGLSEIARSFIELSEAAKTFQFQLARAMARGKPLDLTPLDAMAEKWTSAMAGLRALYS